MKEGEGGGGGGGNDCLTPQCARPDRNIGAKIENAGLGCAILRSWATEWGKIFQNEELNQSIVSFIQSINSISFIRSFIFPFSRRLALLHSIGS